MLFYTALRESRRPVAGGRDKDATPRRVDPATQAAFAAALSRVIASSTAGVEKLGPALAAVLSKTIPPAAVSEELKDLASRLASISTLPAALDAEQTYLSAHIFEPDRGRPAGPTPETVFLAAALERRLRAAGEGAEPTTVAREIFKVLGFPEEQRKSLADHLVRVFRKGPKA
jgi:hypothetical protein